MTKKFIALRFDVGNVYDACKQKLSFLGIESGLLCHAIVSHALKDRFIVFDYVRRQVPQVLEPTVTQYVQNVLHDLSETVFFQIAQMLPNLNLADVEIIPISSGDMDCILYVELNDYSRASFPAEFHTRTFDENAVRYVAGQYRY